MVLCFSLHLVAKNPGILGINFLLKTDLRKNLIIFVVVPLNLRQSIEIIDYLIQFVGRAM